MAHAQEKRLQTGIFWYMVDNDRAWHPCGPGRKGEIQAKRWAARVNELRYTNPAGLGDPRRCVWTLRSLQQADLLEAKRRGLRTALPQAGVRSVSRRESHWRTLFSLFGAETNIAEISQTYILQGIAERERQGVGPAIINRDFFGILKPALRLARDTDTSGYSGDPFEKLRPLDEKAGRRKPIALPAVELEKFVELCWQEGDAFGAYVETLRLTASRLNESPDNGGGFLRYPPYKRGRGRVFQAAGRLAEVLRSPRVFSRRKWRRAVAHFNLWRHDEHRGKPVDLHPHDLRHSALTLEGKRPGATLEMIQKLGGWKSAAMADMYLHPDASALAPLEGRGKKAGRTRGNVGMRGRV